jgi:branched-chain amino acid transport system ATP-binding protein
VSLLETRALSKAFGGLLVADKVNLSLEEGEIHCLIGPNGAGKSTLFHLILGGYAPTSGAIYYDGVDITPLKSFERIRRGISVKFQVPGLFKALTVTQNLEIALQTRCRDAELRRRLGEMLSFLGLHLEAHERAGDLSHGQKQWLEIGMAVSLRPRLLLLDEPTAGMSPEETHATGEMIQRLRADGVTVLAVEHDMTFVRQVADRVTVLHYGCIFAQGSMDEIVADDRVNAIYLGEGHA